MNGIWERGGLKSSHLPFQMVKEIWEIICQVYGIEFIYFMVLGYSLLGWTENFSTTPFIYMRGSAVHDHIL